MEQKQAIVAVREGIDRIDNKIVSLLKERIGFAKEIGKLKDEGKRAKWDPLRERQIYERLFKLNGGVFPEKALHSIFHEIITSCRLSQKKAEVAYLGPECRRVISGQDVQFWTCSYSCSVDNHEIHVSAIVGDILCIRARGCSTPIGSRDITILIR